MEENKTQEEIVEETEEEEDDEVSFSDLFDSDDDEEQEEPEELEDEPEDQPVTPIFDEEKKAWVDPNTNEKLLPQEEVNKIIGSARIKGREVEESAKALEEMTGLKLPQIMQQLKEREAKTYAEEHMLPEEEAKRIVTDRYKSQQLEKQMLDIHARQQMQQRQMHYAREKEQYLNNPLVKKFEKEIDQASGYGERLGWTAAMNFIMGQKLIEGKIQDNIAAATEKRVNKKRSTMAPITQGGAAASSGSIPKEVSFFAKELGINPREAFEEYEKINRQKARKYM